MPRLALDISADPEPVGDPQVSGTLVDADGRATAFVGWVGLLALLQQAVAADVSSAPGTS
jgi:hypothetical protein